MATRFWVGGTGNWDASTTTNWAATSGGAGGASVPTSSDTVDLDTLSNATAYTVTVTATASCSNLTVGAPLVGKVTIAGSSTIQVFGNLNLSGGTAGITWSHSGQITMAATSGTKTITTNSIKLLGPFRFNGSGGTFQLADNLALNSNLLFTAGTFDANSKKVTLDGNAVTLTASFTPSFYDLTIAPAGNATFTIAGNITYTNNLTLTGVNATTSRLLINTNIINTTRTITNTGATQTWSNVDLQDMSFTTAYDASAISGGCGDAGGNSNITFTTATTWFFKATTNNGTANNYNWSQYQNWYTATNGGGSQMGASVVPLAQDNFTIDASSLSATSTINYNMKLTGKDIDVSGNNDTLTLNNTVSNRVFGNYTLASSVTTTGTFGTIFQGRSNSNITTNAATITSPIQIWTPTTITYSFADAFTSTKGITFTGGGLSTGNNTITASAVSTSFPITPTLTLGTGNTLILTGTGTVFDMASMTFTANTGTIKITDTSATAITFAGAGKTYHNVWFARGASTAANTITGSNVFADFKSDGSAAHSFLWTAGTTNTFTTFTMSGSSGNAVTINSAAGLTTTHALVKSGGGTISCDWLNIQHSVATPATTWYAGANSVDNQAVATAGSGWIFTVPPSGTVVKDILGMGIIAFGR